MRIGDSGSSQNTTSTDETTSTGASEATKATGGDYAWRNNDVTKNTSKANGGAQQTGTASADAENASPSGDGYSQKSKLEEAIAKALEELKQDPDYAYKTQLLADLEKYMGTNFSAFDNLERTWGKGGADGLLSFGDIEWAALGKNRGETSAAGYELADYLYQNRDLFNLIDTNKDGCIDRSEIRTHLRTLKKEIFDLEKTARTNAEQAARGDGDAVGSDAKDTGGTSGSNGTSGSEASGSGEASGGTQGGDGTTKTSTEYEPFVSSEKDVDNRLADAIGHVQGQIDKLYSQMTDETSPADMQKIQGQISKLQSMMQMLMSAAQQHQQMLSNIAKMWSDMAMSAIRNTH